LYTPGFFEVPIKRGESLIFSAGTSEAAPGGLKRMFTIETGKRTPRDSYLHCLENSAQQFILEREGRVEVVAGFPWYAASAREALISLPGILLSQGEEDMFHAVLESLVREMDGPLFPSFVDAQSKHYNAVDAPLWFFWTLQQYLKMSEAGHAEVWKRYSIVMERILEGFADGTRYNIRMLENGLLYAGEPDNALTWMNARAEGQPITPRIGLPVEVNALWYNALMFFAELASTMGLADKAGHWEQLARRSATSFIHQFWKEDKGYLADYVNGAYHDFSIRPNQVFAVSLPYSPLPEEMQKSVLDVVTRDLLTERGLRTLSPTNPAYKGHSHGSESERGLAYHNGTAYPWLMGAWSDAMLNIYGKGALSKLRKLFQGFEVTMMEAGIGTVSEVYDGDPPQEPGGAFSYAPSVGELLRMNWLLNNYSDKK
ncbi:MAG TPA: amylo-alpha-1,6-glucosidase, partial [Bacteroidales bacterium]|nr:amylo-alpha-1,6-glucosidase [Bacteroidales bacterium]